MKARRDRPAPIADRPNNLQNNIRNQKITRLTSTKGDRCGKARPSPCRLLAPRLSNRLKTVKKLRSLMSSVKYKENSRGDRAGADPDHHLSWRLSLLNFYSIILSFPRKRTLNTPVEKARKINEYWLNAIQVTSQSPIIDNIPIVILDVYI